MANRIHTVRIHARCLSMVALFALSSALAACFGCVTQSDPVGLPQAGENYIVGSTAELANIQVDGASSVIVTTVSELHGMTTMQAIHARWSANAMVDSGLGDYPDLVPQDGGAPPRYLDAGGPEAVLEVSLEASELVASAAYPLWRFESVPNTWSPGKSEWLSGDGSGKWIVRGLITSVGAPVEQDGVGSRTDRLDCEVWSRAQHRAGAWVWDGLRFAADEGTRLNTPQSFGGSSLSEQLRSIKGPVEITFIVDESGARAVSIEPFEAPASGFPWTLPQD